MRELEGSPSRPDTMGIPQILNIFALVISGWAKLYIKICFSENFKNLGGNIQI